MYFEVAEMPGATMIMDVRAINSVADVEKYIEWMRPRFASGKYMKNQW